MLIIVVALFIGIRLGTISSNHAIKEARELLARLPQRLRMAHAIDLPRGYEIELKRSIAQLEYDTAIQLLTVTEDVDKPSVYYRMLPQLQMASRYLDEVMAYAAAQKLAPA
ncbi:MAG: hypothetical protein WC814_00805 [Candidatus Paceibacterota bacterium]